MFSVMVTTASMLVVLTFSNMSVGNLILPLYNRDGVEYIQWRSGLNIRLSIERIQVRILLLSLCSFVCSFHFAPVHSAANEYLAIDSGGCERIVFAQ